jgi:parvulin-like peptidyl-prolyl isomerase
MLLIVALAAAPRAGLAQGYAPPSGNRPDPYAPQYAPPTAPTQQQPQGTPSAIGLPPVPSLSGSTTPPQSPAAPAPQSSYYQRSNQPPYAPYSANSSAPARPAPDTMRYPLNAPPPQQAAPPAASPQAAAPPVQNVPLAPPVQDQPAQVQPAPVQPGPPQPGAEAYGPTAETATSEKDLFEAGQIVAVVGNQYILYGDVVPILNQYLAPAYAKAKSKAEVEQIDAAKEKLAQQVLDQLITNKLMYLEFIRKVEKNAGKNIEEAKADMNKKVASNFDRDLAAMQQKVAEATPDEIQELLKKDPYIPRLAVMMKEHSLLLPADLDAHLRKSGSSLDKQRQAWGEYNIGRMGIKDSVNLNPNISHQEMIDYYRENVAKYAVQAKAKFEILTVRFDRFPTKEAAWQAIATMGNEVFFGTPFSAVAKKASQEPNAEKGGAYDWTTKGSLASAVIDEAIFSLEVGKLSQILEDDRGFHIVRVTERTEAGQVPFLEAQKKIKEAIIAAKKDKDFKAFASGLKTKTPVWTIYDPPTEVADRTNTTNLAPR